MTVDRDGWHLEFSYIRILEAEGQKSDGSRWRKAGTPPGWALVSGRQSQRWVEPARIHELEW